MDSRTDTLNQIAGQRFDVCVIGGGATGAGCALDCQLRGMSTVLVEAGDFASATSSASTKLIHGGVRYLRQAVSRLDAAQFRVVKTALIERAVMIRNALYLAHPLELLIPCRSPLETFYYGAGMKLYDWISGKACLNPSRILGRGALLRRMPELNGSQVRLAGAVTYVDGQFDDARYNLALVRTLTEAGGQAVNHARAVAFTRNATGKLEAATVEDTVSHRRVLVGARVFVNATGPFSDALRVLANAGAAPEIRVSKGVHILFPIEDGPNREAVLIPETEDGRLIFAIPWRGRLLVGTTETECSIQGELRVEREDAEYLLRQINPYLRTPLHLHQIVSGFAGLRPLLASGNAQAANRLARDHKVEVDTTSGLVSVMGGKWTTYRAMAEDAVNVVQRQLGIPITKCITPDYPLSGSRNYTPGYWQTLVREHTVSESLARRLAGRYGTNAAMVLQLAHDQPELMHPLIPGFPSIRAEVVYGIREEMARTIEDVLARRIGLQFYDWRASIWAAPVVAHYLAEEQGWSVEQERLTIEQYAGKVNRMLESIGLPTEQPFDES